MTIAQITAKQGTIKRAPTTKPDASCAAGAGKLPQSPRGLHPLDLMYAYYDIE